MSLFLKLILFGGDVHMVLKKFDKVTQTGISQLIADVRYAVLLFLEQVAGQFNPFLMDELHRRHPKFILEIAIK